MNMASAWGHCGTGTEGLGLGCRLWRHLFALRLPVSWSGRYLHIGGGNYDGIIPNLDADFHGASSALARGYAVNAGLQGIDVRGLRQCKEVREMRVSRGGSAGRTTGTATYRANCYGQKPFVYIAIGRCPQFCLLGAALNRGQGPIALQCGQSLLP